jgi:hypothetical protein
MPLGSSQKAKAEWNKIIERRERKLQVEERMSLVFNMISI